jgi:hypothetical protein
MKQEATSDEEREYLPPRTRIRFTDLGASGIRKGALIAVSFSV